MQKENAHRFLPRVAAIITLLAMLLSPSALADTNGTELKVIDQPDRLILELGSDWAGVKIELTTDAGVFPVPLVVNEFGVLSMDLGGSKTYTLSRISEAPSEQPPLPEDVNTAPLSVETEKGGSAGAQNPSLKPLVYIVIGIALAGGGLAIWYRFTRRGESYDDAEDDDDEAEYGEDA